MIITRFRINWNAFRGIAPFMSTDECRYVLNGVFVERRKKYAVLVATDGRCLGAVKCDITPLGDYSDGIDFILPLHLLKRVKTASMSASEVEILLELQDAKKLVTVTTGDGFSLRCPVVDGKYPKWREVVPKSDFVNEVTAGFNPKHVAKFHNAQKFLSDNPLGMRLWQPPESPESPFIVDIGNKDFTGIMMPVLSPGNKDAFTLETYVTNPEK